MLEQRQKILDKATFSQHKASDPSHSIWVSANAGTGKTRVLTNRILRLLLEGAQARDILAVTYTRAAAAEMRDRLYRVLATWTVLDDSSLTEAIRNIGIDRPRREQLTLARQLFTTLLDAVVPIRIETMHAFSQSVLRRFPLEANVPPYFEVAKDSQVQNFKDEAIEDTMTIKNPLIAESLLTIGKQVDERNVIPLISEIFKHPRLLSRIEREPFAVKQDIFKALGAEGDVGDTITARDAIMREMVSPPNESDLISYAAALRELGSKTEKVAATILETFIKSSLEDRLSQLDDYMTYFLTQDREPKKNRPTKKIKEADHWYEQIFLDEATRLIDCCSRRNAIDIAEHSYALYVVAGEVTKRFHAKKKEAGLLDYDDLISHLGNLLQQDSGVSWVRYKLDKGIKHLLVDEAQDTNPQQWQILSQLAEEFFHDDQNRDTPLSRSIFSVGDDKQSIYSFQGAKIEAFSAQENKWQNLSKIHKKPFERIDLNTSFRSTSPILNFVDDALINNNMIGEGASAHQVSRVGEGGFVEILPVVQGDDQLAPEPYIVYDGDASPTSDAKYILANKIADTLNSWIGKRVLPARGRLMHAGDILILLRKRKGFGEILERELRLKGLAVAGADRLSLKEHIAVQDLEALGQVMLLPDDNLSLAAVLKSPLFGLSEDKLFTLAHDRGRASLFQRFATSEDEEIIRFYERFKNWLRLAEALTPHEFYSRVLTPEIKKEFGRRLGASVLDVLNKFLEVAYDYENTHLPSLQGFLHLLKDLDIELSRNTSGKEADKIRIMTIHGAKGLEAPVVILPDMLKQKPLPPLVYNISFEGQVFPVIPIKEGSMDHPQIRVAKDEEANRRAAEEKRLLYVALTRAEDGLLIAGFEQGRERTLEGSDYELLHDTLMQMDGVIQCDDGSLKLEAQQSEEIQVTIEAEAPPPVHYDSPSWLDQSIEAESQSETLAPSQLSSTEVLGRRRGSPVGRERRQAIVKGQVVHRLLEILPIFSLREDAKAMRRAASRIIDPFIPHPFDEDTAKKIIQEAEAVMAHDDMKTIFDAKSRAEVPIVGKVGSHVVRGIIDRLIMHDDKIIIIDFKTGKPPQNHADISPSYVMQLGLYAHILSRIWSGREIQAGLVYTEDISLHWISKKEMEEGIASLT